MGGKGRKNPQHIVRRRGREILHQDTGAANQKAMGLSVEGGRGGLCCGYRSGSTS